MPATKANGTLMARRGLDPDHCLMFSQVELRGLEPLTPCMQSMAKMSSTVRGLGRSAPRGHMSPAPSSSVGVGWDCPRFG